MLPLIPLISLASSLVPEIIGLFGGHRAGEVAGKVAEVVQAVTATSNPEEAAKVLAADPAKQTELTARIEAIKKEYLELQLKDREAERQALLAGLRADMEDRSRASNMMIGALGTEGWTAKTVALGPPVISAIVMIGFFVFVIWLVRDPPVGADPTALTLLNVVVGSLVAGFTAVINFWLGSSQGSRDKDKTVVALQQAQAAQATETVRQVQAAANQAIATSTAATATAAAAAPAAAAARAAAPLPGAPGNFDLCLKFVLAREGGFSDDPDDNGGATKMGITAKTLAMARGHAVTTDDVKALGEPEAKEIYRSLYWNLLRCDDLPRGIDLLVFDFGVNGGPGRSVRILQQAVGTTQDGSIGPATLAATRNAVQNSGGAELVNALCDARLKFYRGLDDFAKFGNGWTRRVEDVRVQALLMVKG